MNETQARAGVRVKFHCQWPFMTRHGVILRIESRPREFGNGDEAGAIVQFEPRLYRAGATSFVPFGNERLQIRVGVMRHFDASDTAAPSAP